MKKLKALVKALAIIDVILASGLVAVIGYLIFTSQQLKDDFIRYDMPAITRLTNPLGTSGGTGFFVRAPSGKTYVMTNAHVCELAENGQIFVRTVNDVYVEKVLEVYSETDLCLVEAPKNAKGLRVADSVRDGQDIIVTGHPLLQPYTQLPGQLSGELIIDVLVGYDVPCDGKGFHKEELPDFVQILTGAAYACIRDVDSYALNVNVLPGNSGSPVVNQRGDVVAVVFAGGEGRGFAIPLPDIKRFLENR